MSYKSATKDLSKLYGVVLESLNNPCFVTGKTVMHNFKNFLYICAVIPLNITENRCNNPAA